MTIEEPETNHTLDHILEWLGDFVSFPPSFLDDHGPYVAADDINGYQWWDIDQADEIYQDVFNNSVPSSFSTTPTDDCALSLITSPDDHTNISTNPQPTKKRKDQDDPVPKTSQSLHRQHKKNRGMNNEDQEGNAAAAKRSSNGNKRGNNRGTANSGNGINSGNNKEGRWAEQLLNPCASAIVTGNLSRVQHLLYVINELASSTGDANHRLADHGLRALTLHLSSSSSSSSLTTTSSSSATSGPITFSSREPKFFQRSLLKFYEVSPWFAFPNNIANSSILQILGQEPDNSRDLHVLDIGVSHGVQWPTLLEALTRRPGGPPPLVRITVIAATIEDDQNAETPFSVGPPGDNFYSKLLGFAQSMNINLQINRLDNQPLQKINARVINSNPEETLVVCAQFRLHHLNHNTPDERTEFLRVLRSLKPKGVILSENNMDCSCNSCGDYAKGFSRRLDYFWKFLDSTSSAFKGRESDERRVMEGEAAKALTNHREMNEGKEKWCERMRGVGFVGEVFGEDAIDAARALLRKYDSNWEMRMEEKDGCVGLWWKGQTVSFSSLWKLDVKGNDS